jgi:hypothetical protein
MIYKIYKEMADGKKWWILRGGSSVLEEEAAGFGSENQAEAALDDEEERRLWAHGGCWDAVAVCEREDFDPSWRHRCDADEEPAPGAHLSYSNFKQDEEGDWIEPPYTVFSDYSGSSCERANQRFFLEEWPDKFVVTHGGYCTSAIFVHVRDATKDMLDSMNGLTDYPVCDDQALIEVEMERDDEAWEDWVRGDFQKELFFQLRSACETDEELDELEPRIDDAEEVDEWTWRAFFEERREAANEYWHDDGADRYVDVGRVVNKIKRVDFEMWIESHVPRGKKEEPQ